MVHIVDALFDIFTVQKPADKVLEKIFKGDRKLGSRDRKQIAESVYFMIRHWRRLWLSCQFIAEDYLDKTKISKKHIWMMWARTQWEQEIEIPDWPEFAQVNFSTQDWSELKYKYSLPDWLDQLGQQTFASKWEPLLAALNTQADVFLRANTLKVTAEKLKEELAAAEIPTEFIKDSLVGLRLLERKNVFKTEMFKKGYFEMQDAASQTVAPLLDPTPGERVIDACAGAGGKSLHLAALMKNRGKIIALDVLDWKLKELKTRAARAGVDIIEARLVDSSKVIKRLEGTADALLLDVPCSGLGVLKRNPDTKWRLSMEEIERLERLQQQILMDYSKMVKSSGRMVYATCSILPRENEVQVRKFLETEQGKTWTLVEEKNFRPDLQGYDGFYAALLKRK